MICVNRRIRFARDCAATRIGKRFGNISRYTLNLTVANGAVCKLSLAQQITSKSGGDLGCMIGLDDLKPVKSDVGLLLQIDDLAEDKTPRCTIRLIEAGNYHVTATHPGRRVRPTRMPLATQTRVSSASTRPFAIPRTR